LAGVEILLLKTVVFFRYIREMAVIDLRTKQCVYCAEIIQADAIKCRFCGEFLNTSKARALEAAALAGDDLEEDEDGRVLFAGRPSLWGIAPDVIKGLVFFVIGVLLVKLPLEEILPLGLAAGQAEVVGRYRLIVGLGISFTVIAILAIKIIRLKMMYYEVTPDRIEWSRGILDRRVDNLDMFRVVDLKLRRSILDCIVGVGTVNLVTTPTNPSFEFEKVSDSRELYDTIKKASLEADKSTGVVHLE